MNKLTLDGVTNFALTTDVLLFMQNAYETLEKLATALGTDYIISGCALNGTAVSSGYICVGGKVAYFAGGTVATWVRLTETKTTVTVDTASYEKTVYTAEFASTAAGTYAAWATLNKNRMETGKIEITTITSTSSWGSFVISHGFVNKLINSANLTLKMTYGAATSLGPDMTFTGINLPRAVVGAAIPVYYASAWRLATITSNAPLTLQLADAPGGTGTLYINANIPIN